MRVGLLLLDRVLELRWDAARVGLPRLHNGGGVGGHVLAVHSPRSDAVQRSDMLGNWAYLQRPEPVRAGHKLQLGRSNKF